MPSFRADKDSAAGRSWPIKLLCAPGAASATLRFRADEWVTECGGSLGSPATDCSITVPFWQTGDDGKGSFALVVMLETGNIGIVGHPTPVRAVLRIDRNPPIELAVLRVAPPSGSLSLLRTGYAFCCQPFQPVLKVICMVAPFTL
jgi:hypothetical protein